jgi:hypothetical protein
VLEVSEAELVSPLEVESVVVLPSAIVVVLPSVAESVVVVLLELQAAARANKLPKKIVCFVMMNSSEQMLAPLRHMSFDTQ